MMTKEEALKFAKHELENARNILEKVEESDKDYVLKTIEFLKFVIGGK